MFCSKCGTQNDDSAKFCSKCGAKLNQSSANEAQVELTNEVAFKTLIGDKNQDYYLNHFNKFEADGKASATWHWPAFFVTFFWLLYRKMWLQAALYFFVPGIVISILGVIVTLIAGETALGLLYIAYYTAIFIVPAMIANAVYYKHCKNKTAEIVAKKLTVERTLAETTSAGGTSNIGIIIALIFGGIAIIGILAAIAIPAYQDYTIKAKLMQTYTIEQEVANLVDNYYNQHHALPTSLAEAGYTTPLPQYIQSLTINQEDGTIVANLSGAIINGKTLVLAPTKGENNTIYWNCRSGGNYGEEIKDKYLPAKCKQQK